MDEVTRDEILMEVASWVEEGDLRDFVGICAKRKRDREDAALRMETAKVVRAQLAKMIRGRMENKVGDPIDFLKCVQAGGYEKFYTGHTLRQAFALADKGLLLIFAETQVGGPHTNTVGGYTKYNIGLTEKGIAYLAQGIEAGTAETLQAAQSGTDESPVDAIDAPSPGIASIPGVSNNG